MASESTAKGWRPCWFPLNDLSLFLIATAAVFWIYGVLSAQSIREKCSARKSPKPVLILDAFPPEVLSFSEGGQPEMIFSVPVGPVDFSRGDMIAVAYKGDLLVFDPRNGKRLYKLKGQSGKHLAFSPGKSLLAVAFNNNDKAGNPVEIHLYRAANGNHLGLMNGHRGKLTGLKFTPDGKWLLTASSDNRIIIWNPKTLQRETVLEGLTGLVGNVAVSPDGRTLACGGKQGLTIWDFKSRKARRFSGSTNWVTSVDFNPESTRLALGVRHPHVPGIYNKFTGQIIREEVLPYDEIEIWDVQQPRKLHTLGHLDTVGEVHYSSDGKFLASEGMCYVRLWEAKSGRALGVIRTNDQEIAYGFHFAFSPDGRFLATTYFSEEKNRGFVNIWATETLRQFPSAPKPRSSDP